MEKEIEVFEMLQERAKERNAGKVVFNMKREDGWTWGFQVMSPDYKEKDEEND